MAGIQKALDMTMDGFAGECVGIVIAFSEERRWVVTLSL
jgi:hypothetical protein